MSVAEWLPPRCELSAADTACSVRLKLPFGGAVGIPLSLPGHGRRITFPSPGAAAAPLAARAPCQVGRAASSGIRLPTNPQRTRLSVSLAPKEVEESCATSPGLAVSPASPAPDSVVPSGTHTTDSA